MKKRNGFVSNSSSSSFIITFDKNNPRPSSVKELQRELFGKKKYFYNYLKEDYSKKWDKRPLEEIKADPNSYITCERAAEILFNLMKNAEKPSIDELKSLIHSKVYYRFCPWYDENRDIPEDLLKETIDKFTEAKLKNLVKDDYDNLDIIEFNIWDDGGDGYTSNEGAKLENLKKFIIAFNAIHINQH
jgi:hypothetical protein